MWPFRDNDEYSDWMRKIDSNANEFKRQQQLLDLEKEQQEKQIFYEYRINRIKEMSDRELLEYIAMKV